MFYPKNKVQHWTCDTLNTSYVRSIRPKTKNYLQEVTNIYKYHIYHISSSISSIANNNFHLFIILIFITNHALYITKTGHKINKLRHTLPSPDTYNSFPLNTFNYLYVVGYLISTDSYWDVSMQNKGKKPLKENINNKNAVSIKWRDIPENPKFLLVFT